MIDFLLSNWFYVIVLVVGLSSGALLRPWLIAVVNRINDSWQGKTSHGVLPAKAEERNVYGQDELTTFTRDSLLQIKHVNVQLTSICKLLDENNSGLVKEGRRLIDEMNSGVLKLLSSNESLANNLQGLLQRYLESVNILMEQPAAKGGQYLNPAHTNRPSNSTAAVDVGLDVIPTQFTNVRASEKFAPFDDLIDKIKGDINQASYKGIKNIEKFLEHVGQKHPIKLDSLSDQVFIIFDPSPRSEPTGRAFVMPGSYLGRPWVEWFEMPKGVYERVEATVEPATVTRDANGAWNLVRPGSLSQQ